jgi:hypothetical protein
VKLNAAHREQVRLSILRYCEGALPFGLSAAVLLQMVRSEGFKIDREQLQAEVDYLADKKFLAPDVKAISPENTIWKITAAGRDERARLNPDE